MADFKNKYLAELEQNADAHEFAKLVGEKIEKSNVTLLYGAKDVKHNNAVVLKDWIEEQWKVQGRLL